MLTSWWCNVNGEGKYRGKVDLLFLPPLDWSLSTVPNQTVVNTTNRTDVDRSAEDRGPFTSSCSTVFRTNAGIPDSLSKTTEQQNSEKNKKCPVPGTWWSLFAALKGGGVRGERGKRGGGKRWVRGRRRRGEGVKRGKGKGHWATCGWMSATCLTHHPPKHGIRSPNRKVSTMHVSTHNWEFGDTNQFAILHSLAKLLIQRFSVLI